MPTAPVRSWVTRPRPWRSNRCSATTRDKLSISSTKSQLGHTLGASGGIELVVTIKSLREHVVPPTINLQTPDPDCDLDYTPNQPRERQVKVAMSNSFGFGGHNACIVVGHLRNGIAL